MTGFRTVDGYLQNVEKDKHIIIINSHGDMIAGDSAENVLTNEYYYLVKDALVVRTADAADRLILYTQIQ